MGIVNVSFTMLSSFLHRITGGTTYRWIERHDERQHKIVCRPSTIEVLLRWKGFKEHFLKLCRQQVESGRKLKSEFIYAQT